MLLIEIPCKLEAIAIPKAAEIEVERSGYAKVSYSLSLLLGKPEIPFNCLLVSNFSFDLLKFYVRMLDDLHPKTSKSSGVLKT
jgi:hypothetical protein